MEKQTGNDALFTCLRFTGADRGSFLQGQLTQNVDDLASRGSLFAAWCSPKGRVIVSGRLIALEDEPGQDDGNDIGLCIATPSVDDVVRRLGMYRLRAKVDFAPDTEFAVRAFEDGDVRGILAETGAAPGEAPLSVGRAAGLTTVRLADGKIEIYSAQRASNAAGLPVERALSVGDWRSARIRTGIADIDTANAERYTPHMLNYDRLGALSFDKGCYTGQEVVARTEHLGKVKRRAVRFRLAGTGAGIGSRLRDGDRDVGDVVVAAADEVLAVVPVDLSERTLDSDFGPAVPQPMPYAVA